MAVYIIAGFLLLGVGARWLRSGSGWLISLEGPARLSWHHAKGKKKHKREG
jgi:hypothetical protein